MAQYIWCRDKGQDYHLPIVVFEQRSEQRPTNPGIRVLWHRSIVARTCVLDDTSCYSNLTGERYGNMTWSSDLPK
ncbi:uncharacterized protein CC84DRAFT_357305 [Paraphaeosphaeria sporulosa]|uniref:Uncharacterized protein n=1 Tax=Paraphaeosphaeria sporulosa TaxID=1460663 RepID=A0A177BZK6_9PLEO|nr:uncharacterized protein CC84DRAFT_357305 [Paraphaeosphaeria sporulosa]OAG00022.1 hypothetical protein CC84DRAFT_357305 [Paraphaeosphaeria sporulosa]